jgi:hypothetical protein
MESELGSASAEICSGRGPAQDSNQNETPRSIYQETMIPVLLPVPFWPLIRIENRRAFTVIICDRGGRNHRLYRLNRIYRGVSNY